MPITNFDRIQLDAKLWVFGASRKLEEEEATALLAGLDAFLAQWKAHEAPVTGARELKEGRFVFVAADSDSYTSGCSIDRLFDLFQAAEKKFGVSFLDAGLVFYRGSDGSVQSATRKAFRELAAGGEVDGATPVFDLTIEQVGALRRGDWEKPARLSWHGDAFGLQ